MSEYEVTNKDMDEAIDYLIANGILKYRSPPIQIRVNEEDFEVTEQEIANCVYEKQNIVVTNNY